MEGYSSLTPFGPSWFLAGLLGNQRGSKHFETLPFGMVKTTFKSQGHGSPYINPKTSKVNPTNPSLSKALLQSMVNPSKREICGPLSILQVILAVSHLKAPSGLSRLQQKSPDSLLCSHALLRVSLQPGACFCLSPPKSLNMNVLFLSWLFHVKLAFLSLLLYHNLRYSISIVVSVQGPKFYPTFPEWQQERSNGYGG